MIDLNLFTATLRAQINPNTLETTYHFEYGLEDCALSACTSTPEGTIPAAHKPVAVSPQEIAGLQPGTTYHYRVVAENAKGETKGPDKTFTTPRSGLGFSLADQPRLGDGLAAEQVRRQDPPLQPGRDAGRRRRQRPRL